MTENRRTVDRYMEAFNRLDHAAILDCLTDDVEWVLPGVFHWVGKEAFDAEIENPNFTGAPVIVVDRVVEEGDAVVTEGHVRAQPVGGPALDLAFCDVFLLREGKIRKLTSYVLPLQGGAAGPASPESDAG